MPEILSSKVLDTNPPGEVLDVTIHDIITPIEALCNEVIDIKSFSENLDVVINNNITQNEFQHGTAAHFTSLIEFFATVAALSSYTDSLLQIEAFSTIYILNHPGEFQHGTAAHFANTIEFSAAVAGPSGYTDSLLQVEYQSLESSNSNVQTSFITRTNTNSLSYSEILYRQNKESLVLFEYGLKALADSFGLLDILYGIFKDNNALSEFQANRVGDSSIYTEFINSVLRNDILLPIETVFRQKADSTPVLELLYRSSSDQVLPFEWVGAKLIVSDGLLPIEIKGFLNTDYINPVEIIAANQRLDLILPIEYLFSITNDKLIRQSLLYGVAKDYVNPIEILSRTLLDINIPIEVIAIGVRTDSRALLENLLGVNKDQFKVLEALSGNLNDYTNTIEWISSTVAAYTDSLIISEILGSFNKDIINPLSFFTRVRTDVKNRLESIVSLSKTDVTTPIEFLLTLSTLRVDANLELEIRTYLILDNALPFEFGGLSPKTLLSSLDRISMQRLKVRISVSRVTCDEYLLKPVR